jgi:hypothetical protein
VLQPNVTSHVNGFLPTFGQDDELGRPAVVVAPKAYDVNPCHGGRKIARKGGEGKGLSFPRFFPCAEREPGDMPLAMTREEIV